MTTPHQKVNLNNCTHEQLFKAISKIPANPRSKPRLLLLLSEISVGLDTT